MSATIEQQIQAFYNEIKPNNNDALGFSLSNVKEFKMLDGIAWTGNINLNGKKIGEVECDGDGGCFGYHFDNSENRVAFNTAVAKVYEGRNMIDVEADCFINWLDYVKEGK